MICKNCGTQLPDDIKKCPSCGADIDAMNTDDSGDDFNTQSDFYENTGGETKVLDADKINSALAAGAGAEASEEIFDENEKKRREQMKKMLEDKKKQLSEIERRRTEKRKREKRKKIAIIAVICALAVAAAGIGTYSVLNGVNKDDTIAATPSPEPSTAATAEVIVPSPAASADAEGLETASPAPSASASVSSSQSWTATGNGGGTSDRRTASNTGSQKSSGSASSSGSSSGSSSASSGKSSSGGSSASSGGSSSGGSSSGSGGSGSSSQTITNSGLVSDTISSKLVSGGEVIYNTGTGRYLMTFIADGKRYYANVSEGSTTEQIQNKPFTIDAAPTQESYNGNTVYEISSMTNYSGDYLLENSGTRLLTESDLSGMSKYDLALARNEIFARHGRKFQTAEYNAYFSSKSWYKINPNYNYSDENSNLNSTEIRNVEFILNAEKR